VLGLLAKARRAPPKPGGREGLFLYEIELPRISRGGATPPLEGQGSDPREAHEGAL